MPATDAPSRSGRTGSTTAATVTARGHGTVRRATMAA
jgi:hypothetical protein